MLQEEKNQGEQYHINLAKLRAAKNFVTHPNPTTRNQAFEYFTELLSIDFERDECWVGLGDCYFKGTSLVPADENLALSFYQVGCHSLNETIATHARTQIHLITLNQIRALLADQKLAESDVEAQYRIGLRNERGKGIPIDKSDAILWYRKAAAQKHPAARSLHLPILRSRLSDR